MAFRRHGGEPGMEPVKLARTGARSLASRCQGRFGAWRCADKKRCASRIRLGGGITRWKNTVHGSPPFRLMRGAGERWEEATTCGRLPSRSRGCRAELSCLAAVPTQRSRGRHRQSGYCPFVQSDCDARTKVQACVAQVVPMTPGVKEPTGADCAKDYRAITPPVWGCGTPVV